MGRRLIALAVVVTVGPGCARGRAGPGVRDSVRSDLERRAQVVPALVLAPGDGVAGPLAVEDAVRLALLHNPEVRAAYERLGIACADLVQAGLLRNPIFSVEAKAFGAGAEVELGLAQSFVELFFVPLRRRVARSELFAEQCAVTRELVRLVFDVRRSFARVRAADAVVALHESSLERAEASRELMRRLHEAGNARDVARSLEEAEAGRARLDVDAARLHAAETRESLVVLLGVQAEPRGLVLSAADPAPRAGPGEPAVEDLAVAASLDLLEGRARLQSAAIRAGLARREGLLPELDLGVVGKREPDGAWGLGPSLAVALPLFDHGQARRLAAHAGLRRLAAQVETTGIAVRSAARRLSRRVAALAERERYLREEHLPLRERLVREVLQLYNAMQIGAFDVLRAKRLQIDAQREHVETQRELLLARLDLDELLAGSLNAQRIEELDLPDPADGPEPPEGH